jgi:exonuclease III
MCFTDFCCCKSLGFLHVNTRSLLPKMNQLKVWVHKSDPDVLVITETWLRKSVLNTDVNLSVYNLFRQDRSSKGGRVAIFTKDHLQCSVVSTKSVPKLFDLLVINMKLSNRSLLTVSGCYCLPSALACTLPALLS